jgi:hypothetical protein
MLLLDLKGAAERDVFIRSVGALSEPRIPLPGIMRTALLGVASWLLVWRLHGWSWTRQ